VKDQDKTRYGDEPVEKIDADEGTFVEVALGANKEVDFYSEGHPELEEVLSNES